MSAFLSNNKLRGGVLIALLTTAPAAVGSDPVPRPKPSRMVRTDGQAPHARRANGQAPHARRAKWIQGIPVGPGADLRGRDFTGAVFGPVDCTGARTGGACFFAADVRAAIGLDLGSARIHPFFLTLPGGNARPYQFLNTEGAEGHYPRSLIAGPGGALFWLNGTGPEVHCFHPSGAQREGIPLGNAQMLALVKDSKDRLWGFGDRFTFTAPLDALLAP